MGQNPDEIRVIEEAMAESKKAFQCLRPRVLMKTKCLEFGEIRQSILSKQVFQLC